MNRIYINKLENNQVAKIAGYVESIRDTKKMFFLVLRDVTGFVQIT